MKKTLLLTALTLSVAFGAGDKKECDYAMHMGQLQEKAAVREFKEGKFLGGYKHLRISLFNYASGFKPCMHSTETDKANTKAIQRVNGVLTDKSFRQNIALAKYIKAVK